MRVIAGEARGHLLKGPKKLPTRPTSELVRGAIFSALQSLATNWSPALDLYAGTGALGIEALSRGATWADFIERSPECCEVIEENLERTGLLDRAKVHCLEVKDSLAILSGEYGLIFIDPPYHDRASLTTLWDVTSSSLVCPETTIVMEHSPRVQLEAVYGRFCRTRELRHGDTCVAIYTSMGGEL